MADEPEWVEFNTQRFRLIWDFLKIKTPLDQFLYTYHNYEDIYKHERMKALTFEEICELRRVFFFKGQNIDACRRQITDWISKHKEFYNDDVGEMVERMGQRIFALNQYRVEFQLPYINLFPELGGKLQDSKAAKYEKHLYDEAEQEFPFQPDVPDKKKKRDDD